MHRMHPMPKNKKNPPEATEATAGVRMILLELAGFQEWSNDDPNDGKLNIHIYIIY